MPTDKTTTEPVDIRKDVEAALGDNQEQETTAEASPQYSDREQKALSLGWKPKEEYQGDEEDFVSAAEFLRRGELFERINQDKSKLKKLEDAIKQLANYNKSIRESAFKDAMNTLKSQRKQALKENDGATAAEVEEQIEALKGKKEEYISEVDIKLDDEVEVQQQTNDAFTKWSVQNDWYKKDDKLRKVADSLGNQLWQEASIANKTNGTPMPDLSDIYDSVTREIKDLFPDKFNGSNTTKQPQKVMSSPGRRAPAGSKSKYTESDLTDTQRTIMKTLLQTGAIKTPQQYVDDLVKIGGIEAN